MCGRREGCNHSGRTGVETESRLLSGALIFFIFFRMFCRTDRGIYFFRPGCGQSHSSTDTPLITRTELLLLPRVERALVSSALAESV